MNLKIVRAMTESKGYYYKGALLLVNFKTDKSTEVLYVLERGGGAKLNKPTKLTFELITPQEVGTYLKGGE